MTQRNAREPGTWNTIHLGKCRQHTMQSVKAAALLLGCIGYASAQSKLTLGNSIDFSLTVNGKPWFAAGNVCFPVLVFCCTSFRCCVLPPFTYYGRFHCPHPSGHSTDPLPPRWIGLCHCWQHDVRHGRRHAEACRQASLREWSRCLGRVYFVWAKLLGRGYRVDHDVPALRQLVCDL